MQALRSGKYDCVRINFPNGDMVGHTGDLKATIQAMEAVDQGLNKLLSVCDEARFFLLPLPLFFPFPSFLHSFPVVVSPLPSFLPV